MYLMKNKILIIGNGGHAKSCIEIINQYKNFHVAGFVCEKKEKMKSFLNIPCVGEDKDLEYINKKYKYCAIGIGQLRDYSIRKKLFTKLKKIGFVLPSFVSKNSYVSRFSSIGEGTFVMNNCVINSSAKIGSNCIINTGSIIEHDVEIGDNTHVSTGVIVNGQAKVCENVFIGSGSVVVNDIKIEKKSFIKAGTVIKRSL